MSLAAELDIWEITFLTGGAGFSHELDSIGVIHPLTVWPSENREKARSALEAAREAWTRIGSDFMATCDPRVSPWALEQFGEPN